METSYYCILCKHKWKSERIELKCRKCGSKESLKKNPRPDMSEIMPKTGAIKLKGENYV
jgi:DNA-directed RNA polymerase subunit RPC12/RpoP